MPRSGRRRKDPLRARPLLHLVQIVRLFFRHQVMRTAAQMSYYLLFCLFPLLMIVIGIISLLHLDVAATLQALNRLSSLFGDSSVITDYVTYVITNESPGLMWTGLVMAVMASSAAFRGLMNITGEITGRPTFGAVATVAVSFAMSAVLLLTIFAFLLATVTGQWFLQLCVNQLHIPGVSMAWRWLRYPVMAALGILALTAVYRVCLSKKALPKSRAWPGAIFASVSLVIATGVFSMFIGISSKYSLIYGSLAAIIILLLWFFLCSNIVVLGNVLNYVLAVAADGQEQPTAVFSLPGKRQKKE